MSAETGRPGDGHKAALQLIPPFLTQQQNQPENCPECGGDPQVARCDFCADNTADAARRAERWATVNKGLGIGILMSGYLATLWLLART